MHGLFCDQCQRTRSPRRPAGYGLNPTGLLWKSCPALEELEQVTLRWLALWLGLPIDWFAMTLDGASMATLHAVIAAREVAFATNREAGDTPRLEAFTLYTSEQAHSSVEKAVRAVGLPRENCRKIATDKEFRMRPDALTDTIRQDKAAGLQPFCVTATVGTTSTSSIDPVPSIAEICDHHNLWLHIDAAYAGSAALLEEKRHILNGCEHADSFVVNPHKWLFAPMDLTAFYCKRPKVLRQVLSLVPDYLNTDADSRAVNVMEYSLPLGRRFRALKLWFIMRYFGYEGLVGNLRRYIALTEKLADYLGNHKEFERLAPVTLSLVCFRLHPSNRTNKELDELNHKLLDAINTSGEFFLSSTRLNGHLALRTAIENLHTGEHEVDRLWVRLAKKAQDLTEAH